MTEHSQPPADPANDPNLDQSLRGLKCVRPDVVMEFTDKVAMLRAEHRLVHPAQTAIEEMFETIFAV